MKAQKRIFWILTLLPLAVNLASLPFLPDRIPAHYGWDDQVTRWGSKYETLLFPVVTLFFGAVMLAVAEASGKGEKGENNRRGCILGGIAGVLVFDVLNFYFLYTDFCQVENLSQVPVDLWQLIMGVLGIAMIVVGNIMPRVGRNSLVGIRTRWSLQSPEAWKKSQRFGGIAFILGGLAMVLSGLRFRGSLCFVICMGILGIVTVAIAAYTRQAAREDAE